jgi:hypothetical protein
MIVFARVSLLGLSTFCRVIDVLCDGRDGKPFPLLFALQEWTDA